MGRTLPRYLLRDRILVYHLVSEGGENREFSDPVEYRCHFEATAWLRSSDGRRRHPGGANVWIPMSRKTRQRILTQTRDVDVGVARVGSRVGARAVPVPGPGLTMPFELSAFRQVTTVLPNVSDFFFDVEDKVVNVRTGRSYQIVEVDEWEGPRGPDHMRLKLRDQRGG